MSNVFISYVRENSSQVDKIYDELTSKGINVWLDKHNIFPGQRWKDAIRKAIKDGSFFVACFSSAYFQKEKTYMNEELFLAIDELRLRPSDRTWFIPLLLDECNIPDRAIGAGETLSDIQFIDMSKDWDKGIDLLIKVINPNESYFIDLFRNAKSNINQQLSKTANLRPNWLKQRKGKLYTIGLIGNTGVGKSMLINALDGTVTSQVEYDSIPITGYRTREYQWLNDCQFADIPFSYGFSQEENRELIEYVENNVDLILYIIHVNSAFRVYRDDYALLNMLREKSDIPALVVLNKIDLMAEESIKESLPQLVDFLKVPVLPISAHKGTNVNKLRELLIDTLKEMRKVWKRK